MLLEPDEIFNDGLTDENEDIEIASQEPGGREVSFDENAESYKMSVVASNNRFERARGSVPEKNTIRNTMTKVAHAVYGCSGPRYGSSIICN